jgi:GT2 family glycosyltransferase
MQRTSVICVNYRGAEDTAACVKALIQSSAPVQVVIVDTTPNDPDLERGLSFAPDAVVLRAAENVGFGCGNNIGIEWILGHSACEYLLLLNNDAVVNPESIEILQQAMTAYPDVGIMVPRIAYLDDPNRLWYGGGEIDWRRASAFTPGFNGDVHAPLAMTERDVTFATGCALFIRRSVVEKLGGFDPRFFMYEEDVELCLRARENGIRIRYIPRSLVLHRVQGSSRNGNKDRYNFWSIRHASLPFYAFHMVRNRLLNVYLHARRREKAVAIVCFPVFITRRAVPFMLGGRFDAIAGMWRGMIDFWRVRRVAGLQSLALK